MNRFVVPQLYLNLADSNILLIRPIHPSPPIRGGITYLLCFSHLDLRSFHLNNTAGVSYPTARFVYGVDSLTASGQISFGKQRRFVARLTWRLRAWSGHPDIERTRWEGGCQTHIPLFGKVITLNLWVIWPQTGTHFFTALFLERINCLGGLWLLIVLYQLRYWSSCKKNEMKENGRRQSAGGMNYTAFVPLWWRMASDFVRSVGAFGNERHYSSWIEVEALGPFLEQLILRYVLFDTTYLFWSQILRIVV